MNFNIQLTKDFNLKEFIKTESEIKEFTKLSDIEKFEILENLRSLAERLQLFRVYKGTKIIITSGWRSHSLNARVGGAKNSFHLKGMASDIIYKDIKKTADKDFQQLKLIFNGLLYYKSQSFFHCDIRPDTKYQLFNYK